MIQILYLLVKENSLQLWILLAPHRDCKSHKGTAQIQHPHLPLASSDARLTTCEVQARKMLF